MYYTAGSDPTVTGGATGLNLATLGHFCRSQCRAKCAVCFPWFSAPALFSTSRAEQRRASPQPTFTTGGTSGCSVGLAHAYPTVLGRHPVPLCFCALILFPFRNLSPQEAPPHRCAVHRVSNRLVCRGRVRQRARTIWRLPQPLRKAGGRQRNTDGRQKEIEAQRSRESHLEKNWKRMPTVAGPSLGSHPSTCESVDGLA